MTLQAIDLSRAVTDRRRACLFVLSAFARRGAEVGATVEGMVGKDLDPSDEEPGFSASILALSRTLKAAMKRMVAADLKLYDAGNRTLRSKRQALTCELAEQIVALRRTVIGQYVAPNLEALGLRRLTRRDAIPLLRRAEVILGSMRAEELDRMLGPGRFEEPDDPLRHGAQIESVVTVLRRVVEEVNGVKREVDGARSAKHRAMAEYDRTFLRATRVFEELCRFAGKEELADQVRPSTSGPGLTEQKARDELWAELTAFVAQDREASEALRSGDLDAATRFPAGSYPPALAFVGEPAPPPPTPPPTRRITKSGSGTVERDEIPVVTIPGRWSAAEPEEPRARGQPP